MRGRLAVALAVAASLAASPARADDPSRVWRTIETPHFFIHFYTLPHGGGEEPVHGPAIPGLGGQQEGRDLARGRRFPFRRRRLGGHPVGREHSPDP